MILLRKTIDLKALQHNWQSIRRRTRAKKLIAVVKSDAYGHGLARVANTIAPLADALAIVRVADGILLREAGIRRPIIVLQGPYSTADLALMAEHHLSPVIHTPWHLNAMATMPSSAALTVFLKVNTGMNRLGFAVDEVSAAWDYLRHLPAVKAGVLMTHFANADQPGGIATALTRLAPLQAALSLPVSLGNSAATLLHPDLEDDWGRIGIALYGASPAPQWRDRRALGLRPVMQLSTQLISTHHLQRGEGIGYGSAYIASETMLVGVAACGYGDGYPRCSGLPVMVAGHAATVIGRVSMEMITIDLSQHPTAAVGDEVILWGEKPSVDEVALAAQTIGYDLLTKIKATTIER